MERQEVGLGEELRCGGDSRNPSAREGEGLDRPRHRDGSAAEGATGWIGRAEGRLGAENDLLWARDRKSVV